jgi:hypothetical protein
VSQWSEDYFLEKIITHSWHSYGFQIEIIFLCHRYSYAYCRRGLCTFAAFCLSGFPLIQDKPVSGVGCRSPPANLSFQKIQIGGNSMAYNKAREEKKWRLWKEAEEKQLRSLGVSENDIEKLRIHDWAIFNSDRRFYQRMQETGTYLEEVATDMTQPEIKTVEDFLDNIENQQLYQVLIKVDRLTLRIAFMKVQGYSTREIASYLCITEKAVYRRLDRLKEKIQKIFE